VLDEHGLGHHSAGAAGPGEPGNRRQQMQKQDGQIAHRRILPRSRYLPRMLANLEFAMDSHTPLTFAGEHTVARAELNNVRWVSHCRDLVQLPVAA